MDQLVYFVVVGKNGVPLIWSRAPNAEAAIRATGWTVAKRCDTREEAERFAQAIIKQKFGKR